MISMTLSPGKEFVGLLDQEHYNTLTPLSGLVSYPMISMTLLLGREFVGLKDQDHYNPLPPLSGLASYPMISMTHPYRNFFVQCSHPRLCGKGCRALRVQLIKVSSRRMTY